MFHIIHVLVMFLSTCAFPQLSDAANESGEEDASLDEEADELGRLPLGRSTHLNTHGRSSSLSLGRISKLSSHSGSKLQALAAVSSQLQPKSNSKKKHNNASKLSTQLEGRDLPAKASSRIGKKASSQKQ